MSRIAFTVPGIAQPKGSKRAFVVRRKGEPGQREGAKAFRSVLVEGGSSANDNARAEWARSVSWAATTQRAQLKGKLLDGALEILATFYFERPKRETAIERARTWKTTKPDVDKLLRALLDPLTGLVIADDARIVRAVAEKRYVRHGSEEVPGAIVVVAEIAA